MNALKLGFLFLLAFVLPAGAVPLTVASYTMENGGGGALDYHDFSYLPCPNNGCDITGYPLSGGTGKLTDGVSPMTNWDAEGTQTQWVGWSTFDPFGKNARVTFFFPDTVTVQTVTVWVDNSLTGGVSAPNLIWVSGDGFLSKTSFPIAADPVNPAPRGYTLSGLNITGNSIDVEFFQPDIWMMIGEVSFDGISSAVPEPATWCCWLAVLGYCCWSAKQDHLGRFGIFPRA
jgi:hypothetical protein